MNKNLVKKVKSIRFWLMDFLSYIKLYVEGGEEMMVIFLATRIVLGKLEFKDLPEALKAPVKEELEANGVGFLAE